MPNVELSVISVILPVFPKQPDDVEELKSESWKTVQAKFQPTTPLELSIELPQAKPKNALFPASHFQIVFHFDGSGDIFLPRTLSSSDLVGTDEDFVFELQIQPDEIPRIKVNPGASTTADVRLYFWKNEKLLGSHTICAIDNLGIEGLKDFELHAKRMEVWEQVRREKGYTTL